MLQNKYHISKGVAYIELTQGQVTKIDVADLEKVLSLRWHASYNATIHKYYVTANPGGKTTYLHRFLMNAPKRMTVDHDNHDTLDNRRHNLKVCTNQENNENRQGAYSTSKSGVRGVSIQKCKPSGLMYAFRCHCKKCPCSKYFPYTDQGLVDAANFSAEHYAALNCLP